MKRFMLTAMHSGAGKTVMTCALLAALRQRGIRVRSFKCGPDYIDPMFHSRVLGIPSRNLDLFLQGESGVKRTLFQNGEELAVLEGAMGYYDGLAGTDSCSAWKTASMTGTPAVLVVRPKGVGVSLAAQIRGMMTFREDSGIGGILLSDCSAALAEYLRPILERETGLPVFGYLPSMKEAELESRHLGLMTAAEIQDLSERIRLLAEQAEKTIDLDGLIRLAETADDRHPEEPKYGCAENVPGMAGHGNFPCRVAVSRDSAFCFCYEDSLDALRNAGAELVFFSPAEDEALPPETDGLYLCGGYPELYAQALSENAGMLQSIRECLGKGTPVIAECGGFLYLQETLEDEGGREWPVCGVLPGKGFRTGRLQRFGYQWLQDERDSMLFRKGEKVPAHEFHYWDCTQNGSDLLSEKPDGRRWACGYTDEKMYAAFPHLHLGGEIPLAERFVQTCTEFRNRKRAACWH